METLFEEVDLSIYLLAMGRDSEALEVAAFLPAQIAFSGNYNIWAPTGNAITVGAYLLRETTSPLALNLTGCPRRSWDPEGWTT